jgi:hypothetical protein
MTPDYFRMWPICFVTTKANFDLRELKQWLPAETAGCKKVYFLQQSKYLR